MEFFDLFDLISWFIDPLREVLYEVTLQSFSLLDYLASLPVTMLYLLAGISPLLFLGLLFAVMYWSTRAFDALLDSERVQFVLVTKQWPRHLATVVVVALAVTISTASAGFLEGAMAPIAAAYSGNPGVWAATVVIVVLGGCAVRLFLRIDQTLAFRDFQKPKVFDTRWRQ